MGRPYAYGPIYAYGAEHTYYEECGGLYIPHCDECYLAVMNTELDAESSYITLQCYSQHITNA